MCTKESTSSNGFLTNSDEVSNLTTYCDNSLSSKVIQSELTALQNQLESKDMEIAALTTQRKLDKDMFETQLNIMREKVHESNSKLTEVKTESEAFYLQNISDRKELEMMRRRSLMGGGGQILTQMYETILMRYEKLNESHEELRQKMNDETERKIKLQQQLDSLGLRNSNADRDTLLKQIQMLNERIENEQRDLNRVREERTMIKREYALVMSERDAVHKEMDIMQEDLSKKEKSLEEHLSERKKLLDEKEKLKNQITLMQQESTTSMDVVSVKQELFAALRERKQALLEKDAQIRETYDVKKSHDIALEKLELVSSERDSLKAKLKQSRQELLEALDEAKKSTRWREVAFSERDKLCVELEENRRVCTNMTEEREKLLKQLEEAVKENDTTKQAKNSILHELREMKTRVDITQKQNTHSHDSAIDAGEWETDSNSLMQQHCFTHNLQHDDDISIEHGFYVKYCNSENVMPGDRLVAINSVPTLNKTNLEIQRMLSCEGTKLLQLSRRLRISIPVGGQEKVLDSTSWFASVSRPETSKSEIHIPKERIYKQKLTSEEESQLSARTSYSEPLQEFNKKEGMYVTGKKKKPGSRFLWRKKKTKSVVGTSSTGGSTGGTWPRLSSPSLTNLTTGRLSVFSPNKNRPTLSPNTFTPPSGKSVVRPSSPALPISPTITPPSSTFSQSSGLPMSNSRDSVTSPVLQLWEPAITPRSRRTTTKHHIVRNRPRSAPMGDKSLIPYGINWNNNHTVEPTSHWKNTDKELADNEKELATKLSLSVTISSTNIKTSSPVTSKGDNYDEESFYNTPSHVSLFNKNPVFERQKLTLERKRRKTHKKEQKTLTLPSSQSPSMLMMTTSSGYQSLTNNQLLSSNSLPRGCSASVSSSISSDSRSRTLEYRRIRIPSEQGVVKLSGSERGSLSDRSTPTLFSTANHQVVSSGHGGSNNDEITSSFLSTESGISQSKRQTIGTDSRCVIMVKGAEPIGISIVSGGDNGGIFVSRLTEHSLAAYAGLEYGDQLLEYNGINLRTAKEEQARKIMSQSQIGDTITFLAQYNLEKYKQSIESNASDSLGRVQPVVDSSHLITDEREERTITPDATPRASPHLNAIINSQKLTEPRYVFINGDCSHIKLAGGNATGIYVASIQYNDNSIVPSNHDLKVGDKILEFNSATFVNITLEAAHLIMSKPCTSSSLYVTYEPNKYRQIYGVSGDSFYVRALFDNITEHDDALKFTRNSILLVENTNPEYATGSWIAWLVDELGERSKKGKIPSKIAVEKEKENSAQVLDDISSCTGSTSGKRLSGTGRRSGFFRSQKRRKPHRTSSRSSGDVHLHTALSESSIDSVPLDSSLVDHSLAYQVVEKHSSRIKRPVVLFGPHCQNVVEKLAREHTQLFVKCYMEQMKSDDYESGIIEMYTRPTETRVLSGDLLKKIMSEFPERHVLLELSVEAIDRLHAIKIYPIICFLKYPTAKKIKESQDKTSGKEKLSTKQCKEIMEKANLTERKLMSKYYGTVSVNGGISSFVATKVNKVVTHEHNKVLWLPAKSNLLLS